MKAKLKYGILTIIAIIVLMALTGCGKSTIVATKQDKDNLLGEYSQKIEVNFEGDAISTIKLTMTLADKSMADTIVNGSEEVKFEQDGNTIYLELSAEEYKNIYDMDFTTMSKEEIVADLEEDNFTIEKK